MYICSIVVSYTPYHTQDFDTTDENSAFSSGFVIDSIKELFIVYEKELKTKLTEFKNEE